MIVWKIFADTLFHCFYICFTSFNVCPTRKLMLTYLNPFACGFIIDAKLFSYSVYLRKR